MLAAALVLGLGSGAANAAAGSMVDLQLELADLVEQDDAESAEALAARVGEGLPPAALSALLDVCREHPRGDLEPMIRSLAMHRTSAIRARALLAWAGLGPAASVLAIEAAADDRDAGVRRLAVVIGRLHPSERGDAVVAALLAHDPALAEEQQEGSLEAPAEEPS
jgi:hypothetical protein